jgi:hypothetical protein
VCAPLLQGARLEQHMLEPISIRVNQKLIRGGEDKTLLLIGRNITSSKLDFSLLFAFCTEFALDIRTIVS